MVTNGRRAWFAVVSAFVLAAATPAPAQITVPPGFAVDQLTGRIDNKTPRIEAIRNPAYGSGVVAASISNGILTVRRISSGQVAVLATRVIDGSGPFVLDLRFDATGLFDNALYVSISKDVHTTEILRVEHTGDVSTIVELGNSNETLTFTLDFTAGQGGFNAGAYLNDLDGSQGTSLWFWAPPDQFTRLAQNRVPPGRIDTDVRGVEFDRTGVFGHRLLAADADANDSRINAVYALNSNLTWSLIGSIGDTNTIYYRDIALSPAGALGQFAYLLEARQNRVLRMDAAGTSTDFATGFQVVAGYDDDPDGAASLTISDDGNTMYVSDTNGVYRIRLIGNEPGPVLIAREPSLPGTSAFCNPEGIAFTRLIWSEPIAFDESGITITRSGGVPVPFSASGSGSQFMLISFGEVLLNDTSTITINDTATAADDGIPIDGDNNGVNGGDAVVVLIHQNPGNPCPADFNASGAVNSDDYFAFLTAFFKGCP